MLTDNELEKIEQKYFNIILDLIEKNIGQIISQIYSQKLIIGVASGTKVNVIESAVENILEVLIARQLQWGICSMPISADSCFECGDAIIHIDAKTVKDTDPDNKTNKVNVEGTQTSYIENKTVTVFNKPWEPKLSRYVEHTLFGEVPNLTYILKIVYSANEGNVQTIKLISLPNGQLESVFGAGNILGAGRNRKINTSGVTSNIRFYEDKIAKIQPWRVALVYKRK